MPLLVLLLALFALLAVMVLSVPLSILQRYRMGTARRLARRWIATVNLVAIAISASILLLVAALSGPWVPNAVPYTLTGLGAGLLLGIVGLLATRWVSGPRGLEYTPSRILVLAITLVVLARLAYGLYRGWHAWGMSTDSSWLAEAGAAGSMAAGAIVIGYYLSYWAGVRRKIDRHRSTP
ncbi:MAG TPA: DUF1453 domain-containing protein [Thermoanaerobaculia bacterium]|nr:DUF1453 domain-containing protein [Thermoanaerobaculia bacterium]